MGGANNAYTGSTAVSAGTLRVTGSLAGTSAVSVSGGSLVLSGSGSIGNAATISVNGAGSLAWSGSGSIGNAAISVTGTGTFAPQAGNGTLAAGSNAMSGSAGATLSLASGTTFSMVDGQVGTFNLQQQAGFGAGTTALTLSGATLNFDLGSSGADQLAVNVGKAVVTGTNTIGITTVGSSLTAGGSYPLISAAGGLTGAGTFQFAGGAQTATVVAGSTAYSLTLQNSGTVEKVGVSAIPRGGPIVTPTNVAVTGSFSGRPATNTINSSGLDPGFATNANVASYPADPAYVGNWLENSQPSPGLSTDGMWLSNNTTTGVITFDLGSVQTLAGIWVWNYAEHTSATSDLSNRGAKGVSVYVASSLNSTIPGGGDVLAQAYTFTRTGQGNLPSGATLESYVWAPTYYPFTNPVTGEFIKFNITSNYGDGTFVGLGEVRFQAAPAASNWTGGASTNNWADAGNWSGAVPGATSGTTNTDSALFNQPVSAFSPTAIDAGRNLQNIIFDTGDVSSMTIGATNGPPLMLTAGGTIQASSTVANPQTINAPLVLEGNYSLANNSSTSSATLTFAGAITPAATSGTTTLSLAGANTGSNTVSGVLSDHGGGALALSVQGGNWLLSSANTYTGATSVSSGTLQIGMGGSIGNSSISVSGTGTFAPQPGSGSLSAGSNAMSGSAGATLSLAAGATFSMVDGQVGTFNLQQQGGFGAGNTALTLAGATLNFDLGSSGADKLAVGVGSASVSGTNTIGLTMAGSTLTSGGNYPLISVPAGGLTGNFQFAGGSQTATVIAGPTAYSLTLQNSGTSVGVSGTAIPRGGPIVTPTDVTASSSYSGRPAIAAINSSSLAPSYATSRHRLLLSGRPDLCRKLALQVPGHARLVDRRHVDDQPNDDRSHHV